LILLLAHRQLILTLFVSVSFRRELFRFHSAQLLDDVQVAHVTGSVWTCALCLAISF